MCVIIHRSPGIVIPHEKLVSACLVNQDGMGLVAFDRGKLEVRKFFETGGNKPDTLAKFFEDAKDLHVYAHLRFRTRGPKDKDNVHPFGVLTKKRHGLDVQFMHNGTMTDFGSDKVCDSRDFAKKLIRPLSEKLLKAIDPRDLLHDDTFVTILEKFAGSSSVFLLTDSFGGHRIVNYDNGKEFEGWWASNDYSFNRYHREPAKPPSTSYSSRWNDDDPDWYRGKQEHRQGATSPLPKVSPQTENKTVITLPPLPPAAVPGGTVTATANSEVPFDTKEKVKEVAKTTINPTLPKRQLFIEVAQISDLSEVCALSYDEICDLVDDYPEEAVMLIRDLIKTLYDVEIADDPIDEEEDEEEKKVA